MMPGLGISGGWIGGQLTLTLSQTLLLLGPQFPHFSDKGCRIVCSLKPSSHSMFMGSKCWTLTLFPPPRQEVRILVNNEVDLIRSE